MTAHHDARQACAGQLRRAVSLLSRPLRPKTPAQGHSKSSLMLLGSAAKRVETSLAQVLATELTAAECAQLQSNCLLLQRIAQAMSTRTIDSLTQE